MQQPSWWMFSITVLFNVVGVGLAILIPALQHRRTERSKQKERRQFGAAFGLLLEPKIQQLRSLVRLRLSAIDPRIEAEKERPIDDRVSADIVEIADILKFFQENWENIAKMDLETSREVIRAYTLLRDADGFCSTVADDLAEPFPEERREYRAWFDLDVAEMCRAHHKQAEQALDDAVGHIHLSQYGGPDTIVDLDSGKVWTWKPRKNI